MISFQVYLTGVQASLTSANRKLQEEILYQIKKSTQKDIQSKRKSKNKK